jgi:phosphate transport system permease protein
MGKTFTGIQRRKQTPLGVRLGDIVARWCITVGGIGTIVAVSAVFVFLFYVVLPLFLPSSIERSATATISGASEAPLRFAIDEYGVLGWSLSHTGELVAYRPDTGELLSRRPLFEKGKMTASSFMRDTPDVAAGFEDGTVRLGRIGFSSRFIESADVPEKFRELAIGEIATHQGGVLERTPQGQFRHQIVDASFKEPVKVAGSPIILIDQVLQDGRSLFCVLTGDDKLLVNRVTERRNLLTDEVVQKATRTELPFQPRRGRSPRHLALTGHGESILVIWENGEAVRFDARDLSRPVVAEEIDLVPDDNATLTAVELLIGRRTLLVGDSSGMVCAWFGVRSDDGRTSDGISLTRAHELPAVPPGSADGRGAGVTALAASSRTRMAMAGYQDGKVRLFQVTSAEMRIEAAVNDAVVTAVAIGPKDDRLYALTRETLWAADLDPKYPEVSFTSLFRPVWYEDYPRPEHVWQSTGGTADFEPKLGLWPLIFGTLKATFYSMMFGAPLALLAAIYTSEFMHPKWRVRVKPSIELMASLPSVVLGFLAGNVLAPLVEGIVPHLLTTFVAVPVAILLGAYLWQLLPQRRALLMQGWRFPLIGLAAIPLGMVAAWTLGPAVERWLFAGDIMRWLDGQIGSGFGGWMLMFLPLSALATAIGIGTYVNPWLQARDCGGVRRGALRRDGAFGINVAGGSRPARLVCGHVHPTQRADRRVHHGFRHHSDHLHDRRGRLVDGARAPPQRVVGNGCDAVADGGANCRPDGDERPVFGLDDRAGSGRRRNDDRADGRGQYAGHENEHIRRISHALRQHRGRIAGSAPRRHALPRAVFGGADVVRDDVHRQHGRGDRPAAIQATSLPTVGPAMPAGSRVTGIAYRTHCNTFYGRHSRPYGWLRSPHHLRPSPSRRSRSGLGCALAAIAPRCWRMANRWCG